MGKIQRRARFKTFLTPDCFGANSWGSDGWAWEILMLFLSIATFTVLVIVLSVYHGRSTPELPLDIT